MPRHAERRKLPYSADQMFDLVAAVDQYPKFLPWCRACRITSHQGDVFFADLVIAFKMFRERFVSKVKLTGKEQIDVEYIDGPFRHLHNCWRFEPSEDGGCVVDFEVEFEFRSKVLQSLIGLLFNEAVRRMVGAFEGRAHELYGDKVSGRS